MPPRPRSILLLLAALLVPAGARAEDKVRAQLAYAPEAGCPDEASFRDLVAARLGYDPFDPNGDRHVSVRMTRQGAKLVAHAEFVRGTEPPGTRELASPADRCDALAAALATTIALALDPVHAAGHPAPAPAAATTIVVVQQSEPPPAPPPAPPSPPPPREAPLPPVARPRPVHVTGIAAVVSEAAVAPGPTVGMEIGFAVRVDAFSLEASARGETTAADAHDGSGDRLEGTVYSGALAPCGHVGGFEGCAVGRVGSFQGRSPDVARPNLGTSVFAAVAVRAAYSVPIGPFFAIRAAVEGGIPIVRTSLTIDGSSVWTAPPAFVGGSLAGIVRFM